VDEIVGQEEAGEGGEGEGAGAKLEVVVFEGGQQGGGALFGVGQEAGGQVEEVGLVAAKEDIVVL